MADTLIREGIAYGSQPLSPTPQYWDGASYAKVQGANGATRGMSYNSSGTEIFTGTTPGSVKLTATSTVVISGTSTIIISGTSTVNYSGTGTVEILSSAGGTALFSPTNPGHVEIISSAGNTFTSTSPGLVTVLSLSSGGTAVFDNSSPAYITHIVSAGGTPIFTLTNPGITGLVSKGTQGNAWSAGATISSGATSNSFDANNNARCNFFGSVTNTASITITVEISQDNSNFYAVGNLGTVTITAGTTSPFAINFQPGNRYVRLNAIGVSASITATIAGK